MRSIRDADTATLVHSYPSRKDGGRFSVVRDGSRCLLRGGQHRSSYPLYLRAQGAGAAVPSATHPTALILSEHRRAAAVVLPSRTDLDSTFRHQNRLPHTIVPVALSLRYEERS